jgi:hypothetical protein
MKKLFLLLAAGSIAMNVSAQERHISMMDVRDRTTPEDIRTSVSVSHQDFISKYMSPAKGAHKATKTSGTMGRWYDYSLYIDLKATFDRGTTSGSPDFINEYNTLIWKDSFGIVGYTGGNFHMNLTSIGTILEPQLPGFNRTDLFDALYGAGNYMRLGTTDAFTWDSVIVPNYYFYGNKSSTVADTLRLSLIYTDAPASYSPQTTQIFSGFSVTTTHYGKIPFLDIAFDSIKTVATNFAGATAPAVQYMDILLKPTDTASKLNQRAYPLVQKTGGSGKGYINYDGTIPSGSSAFNIPVAANGLVSCAITFISGDVAAQGTGVLTKLPGDTLVGAVAPYGRYNNFRALIDYYTLTDPSTLSSSSPLPGADWAPYDPTNLNEGLFNRLPYTPVGGLYQIYSPHWSWSTAGGSGAADYQFPNIAYHLTCPTCVPVPENVTSASLVNSVNAVPNPANDELNITFSLAQASNASVTLTNMVGQVVATKNISNATSGKAVFNTAALPSGVYIYTLEANGEKATGRVTIAH